MARPQRFAGLAIYRRPCERRDPKPPVFIVTKATGRVPERGAAAYGSEVWVTSIVYDGVIESGVAGVMAGVLLPLGARTPPRLLQDRYAPALAIADRSV